MRESYFNYDAQQGISDANATVNIVQGVATCIGEYYACIVKAIVEVIGAGLEFNNNEQNRNLVRKNLADQDYMIQQGYSFEEWAAKAKQGIINSSLKGQLITTRLSQKNDLLLTSLFRNYYLQKIKDINTENDLQKKRWESVIITGIILVFFIGATAFIAKKF